MMSGILRRWKIAVRKFATLMIIRRNARTPDIIWDIGGNIGSFACVAGHAFPDASVISCEPDEEAVTAIRRNIGVNHIRNVEIIPFPVTRDGREVEFMRVGSGGGSNIYS